MKLSPVCMLIALLSLAGTAGASVINPASENDATFWHNHYSGGGSSWWDAAQVTEGSSYSGYNYGFGAEVTYTYSQLRFLVTDLSEPVSSATLNLHMLSCSMDPSVTIHLYHATNAQGANGNATISVGGDFLAYSFHNGDALGWLSIDVTDLINSDIANHNPYACFNSDYAGIFNGQGTDVSFDSADCATSSFRPYLQIGAVPEPSALCLLGLGLPALLMRRRRS